MATTKRQASRLLSAIAIAGMSFTGVASAATLDDAVEINSSSSPGGKGTVKRKEKLTLRVAATIVDVLPNGVLSISGSQELRVNFEMRELLVSGFVRPGDISRLNEITYD